MAAWGRWVLLASLSACAETKTTKEAAPTALSEVAPRPGAMQPVFERLKEDLIRRGKARIVLVGDTGYPGAYQRSVSRAIRAESKDFVVALGDLIYPVAPKCPGGVVDGFAKLMMQERFHDVLSGYGAPVFIVLGNHDVGHVARDPAREACYFAFTKQYPNLYYFPALSYSVDLGFAYLAMANTNDLTAEDGARIGRDLKGHKGWRIGFGHHVWRVYRDKKGEDRVRPWARKHGIRPHLWANGHAHLLQLVIEDGVWAATSGAGALLRERSQCPGSCGEGEVFGRSRPGYAVVELDAERMTLTFKDFEGRVLYERARPRRAPALPK